MYLSTLTIENFRCFGAGASGCTMAFNPGLNALVGENDCGKTAVIDALRYVLGTTDQEWSRLEDADFYRLDNTLEVVIRCKFDGLTPSDQRAFVEYLTVEDSRPVLYLTWTAKDSMEIRGRPQKRTELRSGRVGDGPMLAPEARDLLRATYLRPLRDAEHAMSAGRGSRLSQVLNATNEIKVIGVPFDEATSTSPDELSVVGIADFANYLLRKQGAVEASRRKIDQRLRTLTLNSDAATSSIGVGGEDASERVRLRSVLEKLDLVLGGYGKLGLGSHNLLFVACELLLLSQDDTGSRLLLIEEPEAHLHAQRQLRIIESLQKQGVEEGIQTIVTTHSPHLASAIRVENLILIQRARAYGMAPGLTELESSDYEFLQRFLDATKANLFFAQSVVIVEGDAENILLPTLASLIDRDFTTNGVSVVNVGGTGLHRYARIFQRKNSADSLDLAYLLVSDVFKSLHHHHSRPQPGRIQW